jgi:uroporphyrinogen-III synthase
LTTTTLNDRIVIVTRPVHQATAFCAGIEAAGGKAIGFPTIEIQVSAGAAEALLAEIAEYDAVIYISPNAVAAAPPPKSLDVKIFAVGQATAKALQATGQKNIITPESEATSEALLARPELQNINGQKILIVAGAGGRNLLAQTLRARDAYVQKAEIYRRAIPQNDTQLLDPVLVTPKKAVITFTSGDAARNFVSMVGTLAPALKQLPIVTGSSRIAEICAELSFQQTAVVAKDPGDISMLAALQKLPRI